MTQAYISVRVVVPDMVDAELRIPLEPDDLEHMILKMPEPTDTFDSAVNVMRTRERRRVVLQSFAVRLAYAIGERLEDAEGWHGNNRVEAATRWRRGER